MVGARPLRLLLERPAGVKVEARKLSSNLKSTLLRVNFGDIESQIRLEIGSGLRG
jgi:hypothetical protein